MKIGLVLSGGGARGFAQLGAISVLQKNNIKIDCISGTSIGSLIGACYAFDQNIGRINELLIKIKSRRDVYDYTFNTKGIIKGQKIEQYITEYFSADKKSSKITFQDLKIPLVINATNIVNGTEVVFKEGPLVPAIMASLSYPGFFTTRKIKDDLCVDGGITNPLPIDSLPDAHYLILVDVSEETRKIDDNSNIKDIVLQSTLIMQKTIVDLNIRICDKKYGLIRPHVESTGVFDFDKTEKLFDMGEKEALIVINNIKKDIDMITAAEKSPSELEKKVEKKDSQNTPRNP